MNQLEADMRKRMICLVGLCLLLGSIAVLAQGGIDLSGTWKLDPSRSDAPLQMGRGGARGPGGALGGTLPGRGMMGAGRRGGRGGGPGPNAGLTLVLQQTADALTVARITGTGDTERSFEQHFALNGTESTNPAPMGRGSITSTVQLTNDEVVIQNTQKGSGPNGEMEMHTKEEFSLADDGQTLVVKTTRSTPMGDLSSKQVYTKQK